MSDTQRVVLGLILQLILLTPWILAGIVLAEIFHIFRKGQEMPRATVTRNSERFDLKSCDGGYVVIRRMSYGEKLDRQDDMLNMRTSGDSTAGFNAEIQMMNKKVTLKDFSNLIVEHNLTDENDQPLNFRNQQHVLSLDPVIGDEVAQLMDKLNNFEGDEYVKNS